MSRRSIWDNNEIWLVISLSPCRAPVPDTSVSLSWLLDRLKVWAHSDCSHFKMNKWASRGSHPLGGAICQHGPVSRDVSEEDNVGRARAGHPCLWLSDELFSTVSGSGMKSIWGGNDISLFLSVPLRLLQFEPWNSHKNMWELKNCLTCSPSFGLVFSLGFSNIYLHALFLS